MAVGFVTVEMVPTLVGIVAGGVIAPTGGGANSPILKADLVDISARERVKARWRVRFFRRSRVDTCRTRRQDIALGLTDAGAEGSRVSEDSVS